MTDNLQRQMLTMAEDLERLSNRAATIHQWLRSDVDGTWGTGVTQGVERELLKLANNYRSLVRTDRGE